YRSCGQATRIHIQRDVPPVVQRRRERHTDLAGNLSPHVQSAVRGLPFVQRKGRPALRITHTVQCRTTLWLCYVRVASKRDDCRRQNVTTVRNPGGGGQALARIQAFPFTGAAGPAETPRRSSRTRRAIPSADNAQALA